MSRNPQFDTLLTFLWRTVFLVIIFNGMDNQLQTVPDDDDTGLEPYENPDLIWSKPVFPSKTRPYEYTPMMLFMALQLYANGTDTQGDIFAAYGIDSASFYSLARRYPEIQQKFIEARQQKALHFGELAAKTQFNMPDDLRLYQTDKESGTPVLTNAAAAFIKNKADMAYRIAKMHEIGSFIETTRAENINRNVSIQVTGKPSDFNLDSADPGALIDAIRGRKPR